MAARKKKAKTKKTGRKLAPARAARDKTKARKLKPAKAARDKTKARKVGPIKAARDKTKARKLKPANAARDKTKARKAPQPASGEIGEGNYGASRRFRKSEETFVKANRSKIPELGKAAEAALEGPEGTELRAAETEAANHAAGEE